MTHLILVIVAIFSIQAHAELGDRSYNPQENTVPTPPKNSASVIIKKRVSAQIIVDGQKTKFREQDSIHYVTPSLEPELQYFYMMTARWVDAKGETKSITRKVIVQANQTTEVDLRDSISPKRSPAE